MKRNKLTRLVLFTLVAIVALSSKAYAQCPEITINEKYDHTPSRICARHGWDTLVDCLHSTIQLNANTFITTQHFNGTYLVEQIPYNPVDTTFHAGSRLNITSDDQWENSMIQFPFTFMFFGYPYTQANVGSNGLVSFNSTQMGQYCDYTYNVPIPAANFSTSNNTSKNAIYGVYEDIDPRYLINPTTGGMFRSVGGTYPCRYLCASVNGVGLFGNNNEKNTYQIVCYEGTNIIEVHVKQRYCCSSTNSGKGIIGIQNATGTDQESHYQDANYLGQPTFYIQSNSPGAFVAPNRGNQAGGWTTETQYEAWRFTPQGQTAKNIRWWRLFEDEQGNIIDSVQLTSNPGDTNGYYTNNEHSQVSVSPTRTTRYVVQCIYQGANGYWYGYDNRSMRDTITVGVNIDREMSLECDDTILCEGEVCNVRLAYDQEQTPQSISWSAVKEFNGQLTVMPSYNLSENPNNNNAQTQFLSQQGRLTMGHIDSTWIHCTASFLNGCNNNDSILIQTFTNYDVYETEGICNGETFTWNGESFTTPIDDYTKHFYSQQECDSVCHLKLIVSDISFNTDYVLDCKEHTWLNGRSYAADNDDTREFDTVILKNQWGCDSIVTLDFTFIPMKAIIRHSPEVATLDNLTIELFDDSYGHDTRKWLLPMNRTSNDPETSIIFPLNGTDTMNVKLAVHNNYGCDDTASLDIPLHKVANFIPNIFTPDRSTNNKFYPAVQGNINNWKMYIYNRRGEQVSYIQGPDGSWDGTDLNGRPCSTGTYVYIMRYRSTLEPNTIQEIKGTITLIR